MKKRFITTAPRQEVDHDPKHPEKELTTYIPIECEYLRYDIPDCFPVMNALNAYLQKGDDAELIIITANNPNEVGKDGKPADYWCNYNFDLLSKKAADMAKEKCAKLEIKRFDISFSELISTHIENFGKLIRCFGIGDEIYADVTYGSKPGMMAIWIALNFAQKNVENLSVEAVVYGLKIFGTDIKEIYDLTRLFFMDQIVSELGFLQVDNAENTIQKLLKL